jgi:periplasmic protein TonB
MYKNKVVSVSIVIPIEFKLNENKINESEKEYKTTYEEKPSSEEIDETPIPISVVEQIPLFSLCEKIEKREQFKCFEDELKKHIDNNLKYPKEVKKENLERKVDVLFDIDKDGAIINLIVKPMKKDKFDTLFEEEAKRIINKLPKFIPGKQRDKPVVVRYVVTIIFPLHKVSRL